MVAVVYPVSDSDNTDNSTAARSAQAPLAGPPSRPARPESAVAMAHKAVARVLRAGDLALDATLGRGGDTLFLAACVGASGRVFGLDLQAAAVAETRRRLAAAGCAGRVELWQIDHAELARVLPPRARGRLRAIMFNLGYLPGGDKTLITRAPATLQALQAGMQWLAPDGVISVLAYTGHAGGLAEAEALRHWSKSLVGADWLVQWEIPEAPAAPWWLLLRRREVEVVNPADAGRF